MAFYRAKRKGGGGSIQKTTLWTNPSPTADFTSATGNNAVTLSDDMNNYDYLEFTFRIIKSGTDDHTMLIPVSEFKQTASTGGVGNFKYAFSASNASYTTAFRSVYYQSDTKVNISTNAIYRANNTTVLTPSQAIPIYIKGVKI